MPASYPAASYPAVSFPAVSFPAVDAIIDRMEARLTELRSRGDRRWYFHATYLRTTKAVRNELRSGGFIDPAWVERWDVAFADLYLVALDNDRPAQPWAAAFAVAQDAEELPPVRHVLLGMNAHINYDLPQALLAVISDAEFDDPALLTARAADHRQIDRVLARRISAECRAWRIDARGTILDRLAARRFLTEARAKVWSNARVLARARRRGEEAYDARLAELERRVGARVPDLIKPGPLLVELGFRGFGVRLTPGDARVAGEYREEGGVL